MGWHSEISIFAQCDHCCRYEVSGGDTLRLAKKSLRDVGWTFSPKPPAGHEGDPACSCSTCGKRALEATR